MKLNIKTGAFKQIEAIEIVSTLEADRIGLWTPNGHYVAFTGDEAVIYAVGCFEGTGAYDNALLGYQMVSVEKMTTDTASAEFDGKFWMIVFRKR